MERGSREWRERETVFINMEVVHCPLLVTSVTALILFLLSTVLTILKQSSGRRTRVHSSLRDTKTSQLSKDVQK